jgi:hypothetical protein
MGCVCRLHRGCHVRRTVGLPAERVPACVPDTTTGHCGQGHQRRHGCTCWPHRSFFGHICERPSCRRLRLPCRCRAARAPRRRTADICSTGQPTGRCLAAERRSRGHTAGLAAGPHQHAWRVLTASSGSAAAASAAAAVDGVVLHRRHRVVLCSHGDACALAVLQVPSGRGTYGPGQWTAPISQCPALFMQMLYSPRPCQRRGSGFSVPRRPCARVSFFLVFDMALQSRRHLVVTPPSSQPLLVSTVLCRAVPLFHRVCSLSFPFPP